jgi:hypothetical protein
MIAILRGKKSITEYAVRARPGSDEARKIRVVRFGLVGKTGVFILISEVNSTEGNQGNGVSLPGQTGKARLWVTFPVTKDDTFQKMRQK